MIDGGKALRRAIKDVFGARALVHRCQRHRERNVTDLLPERDRDTVRARMRAAWSLSDAELARERLRLLGGELERTWPDAAGALREGLQETLTLTRLAITGQLAKDAVLDRLLRVDDRVRPLQAARREALAAARCASAGPPPGCFAEQQFRRIIGYRDLAKVVTAIERHSAWVARAWARWNTAQPCGSWGHGCACAPLAGGCAKEERSGRPEGSMDDASSLATTAPITRATRSRSELPWRRPRERR